MEQKKFEDKLRAMYGEIETQYRPDVRWWLAEGMNTDETLKKNVQEIHDSGFGAAEFLAMPEPGADSSVYGWGSEEWTSDTRLIVAEATRLGLGFSLTSGSHWATANLPDTYVWNGEPYNPDNKAASKELDYATVLLRGGESFDGVLPYPVKTKAIAGDIHGSAATYTVYEFQGVVAAKLLKARPYSGQEYGYAEGLGTGVIELDSLTDLSQKVVCKNGEVHLQWTAPAEGEYALFAYWMHGTGQTASPSVSTNYTINYMDRYGVQALIDYWEEVVLTKELKETIRKNGRGEIYMDSLELLSYGAGGIFWGYDLKAEFLKRQGYDITRYLPLITMDKARVTGRSPKEYDYVASGAGAEELTEKVRADYYHVISDMYVENVLLPLQTWLHSLGMTLRAEPSYGVNFEISTPARALDGVETESFAQAAELDLYRGMSGSANMYGRKFSSETGAVFGHNYYYNMDSWTGLCLLQFSEGVNRTVFHGYSAIEGSEADTMWPGHEGMYAKFSERFNSRQPASVHYPEWTRMLGRNQKALRQGTAVRDLAILRTDYAFINYGQPRKHIDFEHNYMMYDWAYFWQDLSLQQAGYTYDYFSPQLLLDTENVRWSKTALQPDGTAYKAILLYQETLEADCARKLLEIAQSGLPIFFVNHTSEVVTYDGPDRRHEKAASRGSYLMDDDAALRRTVEEIKKLPNVLELNGPEEVLEALRGLGIQPRVAYDKPNRRILTSSRWDRENKIFYTFVYAYKFAIERDEPAHTYTLMLEGEGVPYRIDGWNGEVRKIEPYKIENGHTVLSVTLKSGEEALIALDLESQSELHTLEANTEVRTEGGLKFRAEHSGCCQAVLSDGRHVAEEVLVPKEMPLEKWNIEIEDWNEGERKVNIEEKFGHTTHEVYYTTRKTVLKFADCPLVPWKSLPAEKEQLAQLAGEHPAMDQVSGLGRYETEVEIPEDWDGAYLQLDSTGGGTAMVWVNGEKVGLIPLRTLRIDLGRYLKAGRNTIRVEVASTLTNRMIQREYGKIASWNVKSYDIRVQDYGMTGARLIPYMEKSITE